MTTIITVLAVLTVVMVLERVRQHRSWTSVDRGFKEHRRRADGGGV